MILALSFLLGFAAWTVSTVAAGGGAILLIPIASLWVPLKTLIPALALGAVLANFHRGVLFRQSVRIDLLRYLVPGIVLGALLGAYLFSKLYAPDLILLVVAFLFVHVFRSMRTPAGKSFRMKDIYFFPAALGTSVLSGMIGATGPVMNPFYVNSGIQKEEIIATKTAASLVMQLVKVVGYFALAAMPPESIPIGIAIGLGAFGGNWTGKRYLKNISERKFQIFVNAVLVLASTLLLFRYLSDG